MSEPATNDGRRHHRLTVDIEVHVLPLDAEDAAAARMQLPAEASVWEPDEMDALRRIAQQPGTDAGVLARSLIETCRRIHRLEAAFRDVPDAATPARVVVLSESGGELACDAPPPAGPLRIWCEPNEEGMFPLSALIETVGDPRPLGDGGFVVGFRFDTVHRADQTRLVRHIFRLQRQELRARKEEPGD